MNKGNVKIMSKAPEISDEEVRMMMNFEDLIEKQKVATDQKMKWNKAVKAIALSASLILFLTLVYLYRPTETPAAGK